MRVVHEGAVLADSVEVAESLPAKIMGLRFRRRLPEGHALVFPFRGAGRRDVDMLFVPFPIDALWVVDEEVRVARRLRAWIGFGIARADTLIELPAGAAAAVSAGDTVRVVD